MRRSREDTAETRRRIVEVASRLFRARGIAAVSVADVMTAAGLTVGGFYRHFASKDALVAEAIDAASIETTSGSASFAKRVGGKAAAMIDGYLSRFHRDHAGTGCPVAALCADVAHENRETRATFTTALRRLVGTIAIAIPGDTAKARDRRLFAASALVGALVLSRATTDDELAEAILDATRKGLRDG